MKEIYIIGHQRSGNVWLARSLGDMYDCEVKGGEGRKPISRREGNNQDVVIIQDHFLASDQEVFIDHLNINPYLKPDNTILIFMHRNPFDVAVSVARYWDNRTPEQALENMKNGVHPLSVPWQEYTLSWLEKTDCLDIVVTYEQMRSHTFETLRYIKDIIGIPPFIPVRDVVENNTIGKTKERITSDPTKFSYNEGIQLKHIGDGLVGGWKKHLSQEDIDGIWNE